ncbi:MAG: hypothetical protein ACYTGB_11620 [Planctomycetota bacterium]|jgi:hypothetical protein
MGLFLSACASLSCLAAAAGCQESGGARPAVRRASFREFRIAGEDAPNGHYDPSLEYGPDGVGWMSYSTVHMKHGVGTGIARSDDRGRTWKRVTIVNRPVPATINTRKHGKVKGAWWHEVSTLVHDPRDKGKEWKLFWHRYFSRMPHKGPEDRILTHSWIAMKTATNPAGPWSEEVCLLGAGPLPPPPHRAKVKVNTLHRDLADMLVFTEPGSLCRDGVIYLSLQAHGAKTMLKPDTILIASRDHGRTWKYLGTPLRAAEAGRFGGEVFTGSSLAVDKGRLFLLVCPEVFGKPMVGHRGTVVFEFEDIAKGLLKRDAAGRPIPVRRVMPKLAKGGQADYDERNTAGGMVFPQFDIKYLPRPWMLFSTGLRLAPPDPGTPAASR